MESAAIENATTSKRVRRRVGLSLHAWENVMIASLGAAGIFALLVGIATYCVVQLQREEIAASNEKVAALAVEASKANAEIAGAQARIDEARTEAAKANEHAASLQLDAEKERSARAKMLEQLKPRGFTPEQFESIVADLKDKVPKITVFTIADPEASIFGQSVVQLMQDAGVETSWVRIPASVVLVEGIASTGITLYAHPRELGEVVFSAFSKHNVGIFFFTPVTPLPDIPSPALFVTLKQPAFTWWPSHFPSNVIPPAPWDVKK